MRDFIHISDAAQKVIRLADRRRPREVTMDSPVVPMLRASVEKLTAEELRNDAAEQGRMMIENGLRQLRENTDDNFARAYLYETWLSIGGGT